MSALIDRARQLLAARHASVPARRGACWLARAALEDAVRELLHVRRFHPGDASMRVQLACLESAYDEMPTSPAITARHAWAGLSEASHHHAYELAPTVSEVGHLIDLVSRVEAAIPTSSPTTSAESSVHPVSTAAGPGP